MEKRELETNNTNAALHPLKVPLSSLYHYYWLLQVHISTDLFL